MSLNHYAYIRVSGGKTNDKFKEIYRFKNDYNDFYLVEVIYYDFHVYAIKFYLKKHRLSPNRYSLCYSQEFKQRKGFPTGSGNFLKVLNTITQIAISEVLQRDTLASFGFLGAPKLSESNPDLNANNINPDNTVANTKRYKVYLSYCERFFNPEKFEYIYSNTSSILLLRNNKNKGALTKEQAEKYIVDEIIPNL